MGRAFHNGRPASNLVLLITLFLNEILWQTFRLSFRQETNETSTSHGPFLAIVVVAGVGVIIVIVAKLLPGSLTSHYTPHRPPRPTVCFDSGVLVL